ncbi:Surf1 [Symbiodinium microadriaticum]|nr:Surf1 [Symbiodinium microadriaticum]
MATNPQGFYIITPFSLQDGRGTVFINRGWIPKNMRDFSRPEGVVEAVGEVQDPEKKTPFSPINTPASGRLLWLSGRDLVQHVREGAESDKSTLRSQQDSIECVIILERLEEAENEGPVDMPTRVSRAGSLPTDSRAYPLARSTASSSADNCYITPEIHLAYALTWFSLSVASLVIGYFNFKKSSRMIRKYAPKLPPAGRT